MALSVEVNSDFKDVNIFLCILIMLFFTVKKFLLCKLSYLIVCLSTEKNEVVYWFELILFILL